MGSVSMTADEARLVGMGTVAMGVVVMCVVTVTTVVRDVVFKATFVVGDVGEGFVVECGDVTTADQGQILVLCAVVMSGITMATDEVGLVGLSAVVVCSVSVSVISGQNNQL